MTTVDDNNKHFDDTANNNLIILQQQSSSASVSHILVSRTEGGDNFSSNRPEYCQYSKEMMETILNTPVDKEAYQRFVERRRAKLVQASRGLLDDDNMSSSSTVATLLTSSTTGFNPTDVPFISFRDLSWLLDAAKNSAGALSADDKRYY